MPGLGDPKKVPGCTMGTVAPGHLAPFLGSQGLQDASRRHELSFQRQKREVSATVNKRRVVKW